MKFLSTAGAVLLFAAASPGLRAAHWTLQYFYDQNHVQLNLVDLACPSADRCIAAGWIENTNEDKKPKPVSLITSDGGAHWTLLPLKEQPRSLFFLNDSLGWMVTEEGLWQTDESGHTWRKISEQKKPDRKLNPPPPGGLIMRVWFLDEQHGFAVGYQKTVLETHDAGRTWVPVAEAAKPSASPVYTAYTQIAFSGKYAMIVGVSTAPGPFSRYPAWIDPEGASRRRAVPNVTVLLESRDQGQTWTSNRQSLTGLVWSICLSGSRGLEVSRLPDSAQWPSEVSRFDFDAAKSERAFVEPNRSVTDAILFPNSRAILAAVEPPGRLSGLPVPGKVKMLESDDLTQWKEMDVDYRAVATGLVLAGPDPDHVWAATDTGMILKLVR